MKINWKDRTEDSVSAIYTYFHETNDDENSLNGFVDTMYGTVKCYAQKGDGFL